ncbi:hypothetical protein PAAG_11064 [Paracoccidioides lutzii Pb01]|uniref:Uncharacterized protein n=1 Tax=Paracoccidioides lutzii (strain ATCC MYA-826 / Pb01) TaxID=502779 RepID=A0A0A2V3R0_PARBA|nr:hypothetical protein PAAG_11064 [Paracoccidioides lutzii Pb01]KGQ02113.1 hypothetical protein PAAG_11064 [Paracoccidioides lutzii Pb01]
MASPNATPSPVKLGTWPFLGEKRKKASGLYWNEDMETVQTIVNLYFRGANEAARKSPIAIRHTVHSMGRRDDTYGLKRAPSTGR